MPDPSLWEENALHTPTTVLAKCGKTQTRNLSRPAKQMGTGTGPLVTHPDGTPYTIAEKNNTEEHRRERLHDRGPCSVMLWNINVCGTNMVSIDVLLEGIILIYCNIAQRYLCAHQCFC